ncbi:MAG: hypothetical protein ACTSUI_01290, partial [Promethearchaeota archaeon]
FLLIFGCVFLEFRIFGTKIELILGFSTNFIIFSLLGFGSIFLFYGFWLTQHLTKKFEQLQI